VEIHAKPTAKHRGTVGRPPAKYTTMPNVKRAGIKRGSLQGGDALGGAIYHLSDAPQDARTAHTSVWRAPPARLYEVV
jgi:hypothetical protein